MLPTVPKDLIDVPQRLQRGQHGRHPPLHLPLVEITPLIEATRRTQLRDPNPLILPILMQRLDRVQHRVRIGTVHMRGDDVDLVHAAVAGVREVLEIAGIRHGERGGDQLCFRLHGGHDGLDGSAGVGGGCFGRGAAVGVVWLVEDLHVGWGGVAGEQGYAVW